MNTKDVADFILDISLDKLPPDVITKAKLCTLDTLGSAIAGHDTKPVHIVRSLIRSMGGKEEATLFGLGLKAPLAGAAMANCVMSHALDSDDGCMDPVGGHIGHIGGIVISAALSAGERESSTGAEFLEAVVAGYEVAVRTGRMLGEPKHRKSLISGIVLSSGVTYGAAAATARLLKLSRNEIINALGICASHHIVPRFWGLNRTVPMTKEAMHWATFTGVMSALMAQAGYTGPSTVYDDPDYDRSPLDTLGKEYDIMRIYFKPYCSCRYTHAALDIILELVNKQALTPDDIVDITVEVGAGPSELDAPHPITIEQAQYSHPFLIGAALLDGKVGPEQMRDSRLSDTAILKQADKVKVVFSEAVNATFPGRFSAMVTVKTKDGKKHKIKRDFPRGEPEEPLSHKEIEDKFREWATMAMDSNQAEEVLACTNDLENLGKVSELVDLLAYF